MNITHVYAFLAGVGFTLAGLIAAIFAINPHDCADRPEPGSTPGQDMEFNKDGTFFQNIEDFPNLAFEMPRSETLKNTKPKP